MCRTGQLRELCVKYPSIALAFWRDGTVDASVFAKWVGNLAVRARRSASRTCSAKWDCGWKLPEWEAAQSFELPVTQSQLGEATGLTAVHVNRTLQEIRSKGLLSFSQGRVEIPDWGSVAAVAEFDPAYLMLGGPPQRIVSSDAGGERVELLHSGRTEPDLDDQPWGPFPLLIGAQAIAPLSPLA